jgi:nucleoside-diphosphate-sugar epimerase
MTISVVTGVAGFIGSHLAEALLNRGEDVIGIDEFNDYYEPKFKRHNVALLQKHSNFRLIEGSIQSLDWRSLLTNAETIYHLAAQAGVRASWGQAFLEYTDRNINATQIVLEAAKEAKSLKRLVFSSSSSIYGDAETLPTPETICPQPVSPYAITKLASEQLCWLYYKNFQVPVTALRYFSVYGPRQRPDMGFHKFFKAILTKEPICILGDGKQTRDFTFVGDVVAANLAAATVPEAVGEAFNIGGGSRVSLSEVLGKIEAIAQLPMQKNYQAMATGDARHTAADVSKARKILGYNPQVTLVEGLTQEWEWIRNLYS